MILGIFAVITGLFTVLLVVKNLFSWKLCAVCLAVSLTWLGLWGLYRLDWFHDPVLLAFLMGQSITGLYYLLEKKVPRPWLVFRVPALLSLTYVFYVSITLTVAWSAMALVAALWLTGFGLMFYRIPSVSRMAGKVIECCSKW